MGKIIAAVRSDAEFEAALLSSVGIIFHIAPDIHSIGDRAAKAHKSGKRLFIHMDLASGIGKDKSGMEYIKALGVDGILSTKAAMIHAAKECGIYSVQRFFIMDSHSVDTILSSVAQTKPDMIEIMPGVVPKVITRISAQTKRPVIAGGLIETEEEVKEILNSGAAAISTGKKALWI
ncbi:MAG: glycerol-3-phosphate responsive antiterminator [Clostridia bacterium]|nr:glycerol-3-phosphate responsive antiterminator [Clostridia bacterium]